MDGSSGAVPKPERGSLPVLVGDPYSSCPVGIVRDPGLWLSPRGDSTAGGSIVTIPVLLLILCGDTRLAARENHPGQILRNRVES